MYNKKMLSGSLSLVLLLSGTQLCAGWAGDVRDAVAPMVKHTVRALIILAGAKAAYDIPIVTYHSIQKWRGKDWDEGVWSKVTFELNEVEEGTEVVLTHEDIPEDKADSISDGWKEHYWDKMKKVLENDI